MPTSKKPQVAEPSPEQIRDEWLARLHELIEQVQAWAEELGWSTRIIDKRMRDIDGLGAYDAPALLLQQETTRSLLEPLAHSTPGSAGVVEFYVMPAYDDIAKLYYEDGEWKLYYAYPDVGAIRDSAFKPVSSESLSEVLEGMKTHAATAG